MKKACLWRLEESGSVFSDVASGEKSTMKRNNAEPVLVEPCFVTNCLPPFLPTILQTVRDRRGMGRTWHSRLRDQRLWMAAVAKRCGRHCAVRAHL